MHHHVTQCHKQLEPFRCHSLTIHCLDFDAGWLERLALLPHLASLELAVAAPKQGTGNEGQPLELPALAALCSLKAYLEPGAPLLRICVDRLPALEVRHTSALIATLDIMASQERPSRLYCPRVSMRPISCEHVCFLPAGGGAVGQPA